MEETRTIVGPHNFFRLARLASSKDLVDAWESSLQRHLEDSYRALDELESRCGVLARANSSMADEWRMTARRHSTPAGMDRDSDWMEEFRHTTDGMNFLRVAHEVCSTVMACTALYVKAIRGLRPQPIGLKGLEDADGIALWDDLEKLHYTMQVHSPSVKSYVESVMAVDELPRAILDAVSRIVITLSSYYQALVKRHMVDGVKVQKNALLTDVAMHIYENVDKDGEIAAGREKNEISAYSARKARVMAESLQDPFVNSLLTDEGGFSDFIEGSMNGLIESAASLRAVVSKDVEEVGKILGKRSSEPEKAVRRVKEILGEIKDLDPAAVPCRDKAELLTPDERYKLAFRNETIGAIVDLYSSKADPVRLVAYVLGRKHTLRSYMRDENSFYVCRIGTGNTFMGESPGGLEVVPGPRPTSRFDDLVGSGFDDLKDFHRTIRSRGEWGDLFVATSPSKSADKSNVLLLGPQGCGKTEAMRSVASEKDSIAIFAVGSDFLTCWKGEAVKNPKRLFEQALKLQKDSGRHVHVLIDELDAVMRKKEFMVYGEEDLTTEFQNLMDGIVHYPNITVWGASNHPERIPMPIIRRFSKVLIVGELSAEDRSHLLRNFLSYLPLEDFSDSDWGRWSMRLDGATGDVVRKVADSVWNRKIQWFIDTNEKAARKALNWLQRDGVFMVSELSQSDRDFFRSMLGESFRVTEEDVSSAVTALLNNVAIKTEIQSAREAYESARRIVATMSDVLV